MQFGIYIFKNIYLLGYFWSSKLHYSTVAPDYVVGAPNADKKDGNVAGAVFFCQNCFTEAYGAAHKKVQGFQYGEKFGYSFCAVDINGDGYDDLVVGAPFHSANNKVSIYNGRSMKEVKLFSCRPYLRISSSVFHHNFRKEAREQYTYFKTLSLDPHLR